MADFKKDEDLYKSLFEYNQPFPTTLEIKEVIQKLEKTLSKNNEIINEALIVKNKLETFLDLFKNKGMNIIESWNIYDKPIEGSEEKEYLSEKSVFIKIEKFNSTKILDIRREALKEPNENEIKRLKIII